MQSLQHSTKRDCNFDDICDALKDNFGGTLTTNCNIVKNQLMTEEIPNSPKKPCEVNKEEIDSVSDSHEQKVKMSQWTKKILTRKDGKGTVNNATDDDEVRITRVLEFIPVTSQCDAKEGKTVRFMHKIGTESVHWLQGTLEKKMTDYKTARGS